MGKRARSRHSRIYVLLVWCKTVLRCSWNSKSWISTNSAACSVRLNRKADKMVADNLHSLNKEVRRRQKEGAWAFVPYNLILECYQGKKRHISKSSLMCHTSKYVLQSNKLVLWAWFPHDGLNWLVFDGMAWGYKCIINLKWLTKRKTKSTKQDANILWKKWT